MRCRRRGVLRTSAATRSAGAGRRTRHRDEADHDGAPDCGRSRGGARDAPARAFRPLAERPCTVDRRLLVRPQCRGHGTPLPWFRIPLGFVTLAGPPMPYNDRFGFSVADYATSASFWSDTGFPGLQKSFGSHWPLLVSGAFTAALLAATRPPAPARGPPRRHRDDLVAFGEDVFTPWSAGGPDGDPHLFALDLRFLAPARARRDRRGPAARRAASPSAHRRSSSCPTRSKAAGDGRLPYPRRSWCVQSSAPRSWLSWISTRTIARSTGPSRRLAIVTLGAIVLGVALLGVGLQDTYLDGRYAVADASYAAVLSDVPEHAAPTGGRRRVRGRLPALR